MLILPRPPVISGEIKKGRTRQRYRIGKSNKIRESAVKDKAHHAVLESVCIQIMCIQAAESSIAQHASVDHVLIQIMSIQAVKLSRAHHSVLEHVRIQN